MPTTTAPSAAPSRAEMHHAAPLTDLLHMETYGHILQIGALPFFEQVHKYDLPPDSYIALLHGLDVIYAAFDEAASHATLPEVRKVIAPHLNKRTVLAQDKAAFAQQQFVNPPAAQLWSQIVAEQLHLRGQRSPLSLLGTAYVLAIWNMGGAGLCQEIAQAMRLPGHQGMSYMESFDAWGAAHWHEFAGALNGLHLDSIQRQHILLGADEAVQGITQLIDLVYPLSDSPTTYIPREITLRDGSVTIPHDMREVRTMLRAGDRYWRLFPYVELRYGRKGHGFEWGDGVVMGRLAAVSQEAVDEEIDWTVRMIGARGIPMWSPECYMLLLYEDAVQAMPERAASFRPIYDGALRLANQRRTVLSDELLQEFDQRFANRVGPEWNARLPHVGGFIAAAVATERIGIAHAIENFEKWMTDANRFPPAWIQAFQTTMEEAKARI